MTDFEQSVQDAGDVEVRVEEMPDFMRTLPARHPSMPLFEAGRVDRLGPGSFQAMPTAPGLLVRMIAVAERYSDGKVVARMLKMDPSAKFEGPSAVTQCQGVKIVYVLKGWASYEMEGLGETRLDAKSLVCLPPSNRHRLVDASPDFENIEYELPLLTASLAKTWSTEGPSCATAAMIDTETSESFEAIPNFVGAVERYMRVVQNMTGGAVKAAVLRANPPHIWDGSPWHIHHNNFICALFTKGSGTMGYEEFGDLPLKTGDFFIQQGEIRHREVVMSEDFEILALDMPAAAPSTVLIYDRDLGAFKTMMFTSAQEAGEAFDLDKM